MKYPKSFQVLPWAAVLTGVVLGGCTSNEVSSSPDGRYEGKSQPDDQGAYATVQFTIKNHKIVDAKFFVQDKNGTVHDEKYGLDKTTGKPITEVFYSRAQQAIKAEQKYVEKFKETSNSNDVHVIAGATLSHKKFLEAVDDAIAQGKKTGN